MSIEEWIAELTSGDDEQAEAAALALGEAGAEAADALLPLCDDPRPEVRWWALRAAAEIPDARLAARSAAALHDPEPAVRQCAAIALRRQPAPQAVPDLAAALGSRDRMLARLAGDALAAAGEPAIQPLIEVLQDLNSPPPARQEAARALALIGDPRSIPALFAVLDDDSAWIQHWANEGLERMGVGMTFFKP